MEYLEEYKWILKSIDSSHEELSSLSRRMSKAKTPAEIGLIRAEMEKVIKDLEETTSKWARNDARDAMRDSYRVGAYRSSASNELLSTLKKTLSEKDMRSPIPKRWRDRSLRLAQKHEKSFKKSASELRAWASQYEKAVRVDKAAAAYEARIKELTRKARDSSLSKDQRIAAVKEAAELERQRKSLSREGFPDQDPRIRYRKKGYTYTNPSTGNKIKVPASVTEYPSRQHYKMIVDTAVSQQANLGVYGYAAQNNLNLEVVDGPECGWVTHDDVEKANGMVVTWDEAASHPLAHPNCQRQFYVTKRKPTKRMTDGQKAKILKAMEREAAKSVARKRAEKVAQVAGAATLVASATFEVGRNPYIRKAVRDIIDDAEMNIPESVKRALNLWIGNMKGFESRAMALTATKETPEQFRNRIAASIDQRFANEEFLHAPQRQKFEMTLEQARALGFKTKTQTKSDILNAIDNYGDFILHEKAKAQNLLDNIALERIATEARESMGISAIRYSVTKKPGQAVFKNWSRTVFHLKNVAQADPERLGVEAVRTLAAIFDPTPWIGARMRNFKFTVGLSSQGRQDLAEFLFERFRGTPAFHPKEIEWARQLGVDLTEFRVNRIDIAKGLIPRLTYLGKPFSATIALEDGFLSPVFRFYPDGTYTQFLRFQAYLSRKEFDGYLDDLKQFYQAGGLRGVASKKSLEDFLSRVDEAFILSVDAFRNGPIQASIRFTGVNYGDIKKIRSFSGFQKWMTDGFSSFAIKIRPDQQWLRFNYRIYRHNLRVKLQDPYYVRGQLKEYEIVNRLDQEYKLGIIPFRGASVNLTGPVIDEFGNVDMTDLVARLYVWRGNIAEVSRLTGLSYESIVNHLLDNFKRGIQSGIGRVEDLAKHLEALIFSARQISLTGVENLRDLEQRLARIKYSTSDSVIAKRIRENFGKPPHPALSDPDLVDQELVGISRELDSDLSNFYSWWDSVFGSLTRPRIRMYDEALDGQEVALVWYNQQTKDIVIGKEVAENWNLHGLWRSSMVKVRNFPHYTNQAIGSLVHEAAHFAVDRMGSSQYRRLWSSVFNSYKTWEAKPPDVSSDLVGGRTFRQRLTEWLKNPKVAKQIAENRLSIYGVTSIDEFIAEALTEYLLAPDSAVRNIARSVGEWFEREGGRGFLRSM